MRMSAARQRRTVAMAQARNAVHEVQDAHNLSPMEFLSVLLEVQTEIVKGHVHLEHQRAADAAAAGADVVEPPQADPTG
jgi:hypothetical protein